MPAAISGGGSYVLEGTLEQESVRDLFDRAAVSRFSGVLELSEGARRASVGFVAGKPVDGPDLLKLGTQWRSGGFRLVQRAVEMSGRLAPDVRLEGALGERSAADVCYHCESARQ